MRAQRKLVSFIGLGSAHAAPLLYSYLRAHPEVCVLEQESSFFSDTKIFSRGVDWYESLFDKFRGQKCLYGELTGSYLQSAQAASLIARTYSSAKLIAVIENPLISVRVSYIEALRTRTISNQISLAMYLKQNPDVLTNAKYGRQLAQYFSYYSITDLLVLVASDIGSDPLSQLKLLFKHLNIEANFVPVALKHLIVEDEDVQVKKPGIIKKNFKIIKNVIRKTYHAILNKINPVSIPVETAAVLARQMKISPELESYLKAYYKHDVELLSSLLNRNVAAEWEIV
jgi:hypothetical protein